MSTPPLRVNGIKFPDGSTATTNMGGNAVTSAALRLGLPTQYSALTTSPTVSVASANPGSTPTLVAAGSGVGGTPVTSRFTFSGGAYEVPTNAFPFTNAAGRIGLPNQPYGFTNSYTDFLSDAPIITFQHVRSEQPVSRFIVDGVEYYRIGTGIRANTAQAGGASTITLDSGASATNNIYVGNWVRTTGGTGSGQIRQITGYVGSTKVATVGQAWGTNPDATTTFEITIDRADFSNLTQTGWGTYYVTLSWNGERRMRHYRIEHSGQAFFGVNVTGTFDTVVPADKPNATKCIWAGDSFSAGTGTDGEFNSLARVTCDLLGWELINLSVGGTGVLNPGNGLTLPDRITPPVNAWYIKMDNATGGTFTVTQNSITATLNYNDSSATAQATLDAQFGAGKFKTVYGTGGGAERRWIIGEGSNATFSGAMTANFSGITGAPTTPTITQWKGDLATHAPVDGNNNTLPFVLVIAMGHNDTTDTNAGYTQAAMQTAMTTMLQNLAALYPLATIFVIGNMFLPGASLDSAVTNCNAGISAACTAALSKINGNLPFIDTITSPWFTGTGNIGNFQSNGNSDYCCYTDAVHPTTLGHLVYGRRIARTIQSLLLGT